MERKMTRLRINGARAIGARPNSPILFKVPAIGNGILKYHAHGLPDGLKINVESGVITGSIGERGEYNFDVHVSDNLGMTTREMLIIIGDNICLTPFMGWNSWYCQSELISEKDLRRVTEVMVEKNLINHGWSYINMDDCWQAIRVGHEPIQGNERFDCMAGLCDFIHSKGLKAGIYSTPWISTYAGFNGGSIDDDHTSRMLPEIDRHQINQAYGRWPGLEAQQVDRVGKHWLFDIDAQQWAEWGFDFVKVDWLPNDIPTTKHIWNDINIIGRDMIISLSNEAPIANAEGLTPYCNSLRTTSDIVATWKSISRNFALQEPWLKYIKPGYWIDPDMLLVGNIAVPNNKNKVFKLSPLSKDEQISQMSLWCLLSAPLLISCDVESLDDFTISLLSNDDAIDINQDYPANPPVRIIENNGVESWFKELHNDHFAVGIFNLSDEIQEYVFSPSAYLIDNKNPIINVWGSSTHAPDENINVNIPPHGVALFKTVGKIQ
jgi:alpha-galactosidase